MMSPNNPFILYQQKKNSNIPNKQEESAPKKNPFFEMAKKNTSEPEEDVITSTGRYATQVPQALLATTPSGITAGLWQLLATGEALDPEEIEHIKKISEREGIPFDENAYRKAAQTALGGVPTVSNIASKIEEKTGLPLEPKTRGQKALRFVTEATRLIPENSALRGTNVSLPKPVLGTTVEGIKEVLQEAGLPEPIAELASFAAIKQLPEGSASIKIGKETKPSGLSTKRYEKLEKPTEISKKTIKNINAGVESEFRDIADKIIEKSPINETYSALKNDSGFKVAAKEAFSEVEKLSEQLPNLITGKEFKKNLAKIVANKKGTGFLPSDFDVSYKKHIKEFIKNTSNQNIRAKDLVKQYRKNNEALTQSFEPGKSFAYNRGKREALLDYNKSIGSMIEKEFPGTEFSDLFKSSNKQWSEIMDAEAIDKFMDKLFSGKINFEKGKNFFEKEGMTIPFKKALGENFQDFNQLMKDLMTKEQAHKMMKVAKSKGYGDLAKTGMAYVLHPKIGLTKMGLDISKITYRKLWEHLLDKPQLAIKWDKGVQAFKKGDFSTAEKAFQELNLIE